MQELQTLRAAQEAEISRRQEFSKQESEKARIVREEAIRSAEISRERELEVADQDRLILADVCHAGGYDNLKPLPATGRGRQTSE